MANGRNPKKRGHDRNRDAGGFVALPWAVLDSAGYRGLSHPARSLLMEIARQVVGDNNGRLLASASHLARRGWSSNDVLTRAKRELLEAGFIHETVKGRRPNRAGWYAVTWRALDRHAEYDLGAVAAFERGAYAAPRKSAILAPSGGALRPAIGPSRGVGTSTVAPPHGAIRGGLGHLSTPSHGHHLESHLPAPFCTWLEGHAA